MNKLTTAMLVAISMGASQLTGAAEVDISDRISVQSLIEKYFEKQDPTYAAQAAERCAALLFILAQLTDPDSEVGEESERAWDGATHYRQLTAMKRNQVFNPEVIASRIVENSNWYMYRMKYNQNTTGTTWEEDELISSDIPNCRAFVRDAGSFWIVLPLNVVNAKSQ